MATHSNILAWRVPWTEEAGGLQSIGLHRVWHNWSDLAYMHSRWSRMAPYKWLLLLASWVVILYQLCWEVHVIKSVCSLHLCHHDLLVPFPLSKHWINWRGKNDSYWKDNFVHVIIEGLLCHGSLLWRIPWDLNLHLIFTFQRNHSYSPIRPLCHWFPNLGVFSPL